jgi:cytidylate kinase
MIIAIDGPAGSGKSSTAKMVASRLKIVHLDTGAMYRAITLKCLRNKIDFHDHEALGELLIKTDIYFTGAPPSTTVWMDGDDVSNAIRNDDVTKNVSDYCAVPIVRTNLVALQRKIGNAQSTVCEGRDIGTVVFPNADLKIFMVASVEERAKRRQKDFEKIGVSKSITELIAEISERDNKDSTRSNSPLVKAADALELDTTTMTLEKQVQYIVGKAEKLMR